MLNDSTLNIVDDVYVEFTNRGNMFAVYDVTKAARSQTSQKIDHTDVQEHVHDEWDNGEFPTNYTRTLHTFQTNGKTVQAYVYHLIGQDVNNYDPDAVLQPHVAAMAALGTVSNVQQNANSSSFTVQPATVTPAQNKQQQSYLASLASKKQGCCGGTCHNQPQAYVNNSNKYETVNTDSRGRLCIPNYMVKAVGFQTGDTVYANLSSLQGLLVLTKVPWNHPQVGSTVVDSSMNIRVTPTMLRKCNYSGKRFNVRLGCSSTGIHDHITIEM